MFKLSTATRGSAFRDDSQMDRCGEAILDPNATEVRHILLDVIDVEEHPIVLRPAGLQEDEVEPDHHHRHYLICGRVYAGIFVGRYDDG